MLTTIITSTNFKSFVKSLSKKSKSTTSSIPLLTAQEILAETFFYRNHHELIQSVKNDSFVNIHLNQETYSNISNRFLGILRKYDIQLDDESANSLFVSTFGLEENRKLSIVDILKELITIRDMPDSQMDKLYFGYFGGKTRLFIRYDYTLQKTRVPNAELIEDDKIISILEEEINKKYPNLFSATFSSSKYFLINVINNLNPSEKIRDCFSLLLDTLFSYSTDELLNTFNNNKKLFLVAGDAVFVLSVNCRENHTLINQNIFEKKYILLEKAYIQNNDFNISPIDNLFILHNSSMAETTDTKYFNNAILSSKKIEKYTFENYDSAVRYLKKIHSEFKYVIVPVNKVALGYDTRAFHFDEYFGLEIEKSIDIQ